MVGVTGSLIDLRERDARDGEGRGWIVRKAAGDTKGNGLAVFPPYCTWDRVLDELGKGMLERNQTVFDEALRDLLLGGSPEL